MLISLLTYLLISNALTLSKDKSILFSRIVMASLTLTSCLAFNNLFSLSLDKGIGVYGGLLHVTAFTQTITILFMLFTTLILAYVHTKDIYFSLFVPGYYEIYKGLFFSYTLINLVILVYSLLNFHFLYMFMDFCVLDTSHDFSLDTLNMQGDNNQEGTHQDSKEDQSTKPKKPRPSFIKIGPDTDIEKDLAKIGNCTHDKLGQLRPNGQSDVDILECDFSYTHVNGKPDLHKALTSVNDVAFVCQECQAIFCKDCVNADEYVD